MHIDVGKPGQQFPFFAVWAFIAGFSERFVRDTLDGVEKSVGGFEPTVEQEAAAGDAAGPS